MSNIKVKDLPEKIDNLQDEDLLVIEDQEDTKKISLVRLRSAFSMDGKLTSIKEMLLEKINTFIVNHNAEYAYLVERNRQLENTCTNLENDRIHDKDRIFELEDRLVVQTEEIKKLKEDNLKLILSVNDLVTDNNNLIAKNEELEIKVSEAEITITDYNTKYNNLKKDYDTSTKQIEDLKVSLDKLQTGYSEDVDKFIEEKNNELLEKIDELKRYIQHYHPDMDDLEV